MHSSSPNSTSDTYTPHNSSVPLTQSGLSGDKQGEEKGAEQQKAPTMGQAGKRSGPDKTGKPPAPERPHADPSPRVDDEDFWAHLDALRGKAMARRGSEAADKAGNDGPTTRSEPAFRNRQHPDANQQARQDAPALPTVITHSAKKGGVDPDLFDQLGQVRRGQISTPALAFPPPLPQQLPQQLPQSGAMDGAPRPKAEVSGLTEFMGNIKAAPDGFYHAQGIKEFHLAVYRQDEEAVRHLLAAGENPGRCKEPSLSPLGLALIVWPDMALALAAALPDGARANADDNGDTEVHLAVDHPEVLYVLLAKGMRDRANHQGTTALMLAAEQGALLPVKYLLGKPPGNGSDHDLSRYLNQSDFIQGQNALGHACFNNHDKIADLLIRHGADPSQYPDRTWLLRCAVNFRNADLLRLLLAAGAAAHEPRLHDLLLRATKKGWTEVVEVLVKFVSPTHAPPYKLMRQWLRSPKSETLTLISPLIPLERPSVNALMQGPRFLRAPFDAGSPELLQAMLEFFDQRDSFSYVIQSFISKLIDDQGATCHADLGRTLLRFVLPRFSRLNKDKETVMRLLQLSERLKDYTLITEIKALNSVAHGRTGKNIPFNPTWLSDPVSLEFLGVKKDKGAKTRLSNLLNTVTSRVAGPGETRTIDGAQLSNDLIFALKSDAVGDALDKVFDDHQLSAIVRQGLKPLLQGLVTQLYPDPSTRVDAVCRFLIAYAFSRLADHPHLIRQPAFELIRSHPAWQTMKQTMAAEIEAIEDVAASIIETVRSELLGTSLPDLVASLTMRAMSTATIETSLIEAFRSTLGLLDTPARQLARACASASRTWRASATSSTSTKADTPTGTAALTSLIRQAFVVQKRVAHLPEEFVDVSLKIDADLVDDFNNLVWWQMDTLAEALGVAEHSAPRDGSASVVSDSDERVEEKENEKS